MVTSGLQFENMAAHLRSSWERAMEQTEIKQITSGEKRDPNAVVAVFKDHVAADEAVKQLQRSGFDMRKLSVIGRGYHTEEQVVGYYNTGDRMKLWGKWGAFWGAKCGSWAGISNSFRRWRSKNSRSTITR